MAAAMIAGTITSCSKDGDDITVDRIHTTATAEKISIETESYNESVIVAPDLLTAPIGLETNLDIKILGVQDATCKSDDEKIATITNGKLKGVATGETTISICQNDKVLRKIKVIAHKPLVYKDDYNDNEDIFKAKFAFWMGDQDYQNGTYSILCDDGPQFSITIAKGKIARIGWNGPTPIDISKCSYTFDKESQILSVTFDIEDNNQNIYQMKGSIVAKLGDIPLWMMQFLQ